MPSREDIFNDIYDAGTKSLGFRPNPRRGTGALHRNAITAADVVAAPGNPTLTDVAAGGALAFNTTYNVGLVAISLQSGSAGIIGTSTVNASIQAVTTANDAVNTHKVRVAWSAVTNADAYLIFLSTDAAPKLVAYVTEAQRAAGGVVTAVFGAVAAGGAVNSIDIGIAGTGLQTSNTVFAFNTAHLPHTVATVGSIACAGYTSVHVHVRAKLSKATVWSAAPALNLLTWLKTSESSPDWFVADKQTTTLMTKANDSLSQTYKVDVNGATAMVVTMPVVTGLASVDVWVEPV